MTQENRYMLCATFNRTYRFYMAPDNRVMLEADQNKLIGLKYAEYRFKTC